MFCTEVGSNAGSLEGSSSTQIVQAKLSGGSTLIGKHRHTDPQINLTQRTWMDRPRTNKAPLDLSAAALDVCRDDQARN